MTFSSTIRLLLARVNLSHLTRAKQLSDDTFFYSVKNIEVPSLSVYSCLSLDFMNNLSVWLGFISTEQHTHTVRMTRERRILIFLFNHTYAPGMEAHQRHTHTHNAKVLFFNKRNIEQVQLKKTREKISIKIMEIWACRYCCNRLMVSGVLVTVWPRYRFEVKKLREPND